MLSPDDFYQATSEDLLRMENELLTLENRLLRGAGVRAVSPGRENQIRREIMAKVAEDRQEWKSLYKGVPHDEFARMRKAESDLRWLLARMQNTPARLVLKRWSGWRTLVERYLS